MKFVIFITLSLLSGCSYIINKAHIKSYELNGWNVSDSGNVKKFTYVCKSKLEVSVESNRKLASDSVYLLFSAIPIGNASYINGADSNLNLNVNFSLPYKTCSTNDLSITTNNEVYHPVEAENVKGTINSCNYNWNMKLSGSGGLDIKFKNINQCKLPVLHFEYSTESEYHYDKMQG